MKMIKVTPLRYNANNNTYCEGGESYYLNIESIECLIGREQKDRDGKVIRIYSEIRTKLEPTGLCVKENKEELFKLIYGE